MIKNKDNIINENVRGLPPSPYVAIKVPPVAPIQRKFEQTIANLSTLNKNESLCNRGLNTQFTYNIAQIQALFHAIYREGVTTPQDYKTIETVSNEITKLENSLENQNLSPSDRVQALKYIKEARHSVTETYQLAKSLEAFYPLVDEFDDAIGAINDRTLSPLYRGESLMAALYIKKACTAIENIRKLTNSFPDKSAAKIRLNNLLKETEKEWKFTLEEWEEELFNDIHSEINDFAKDQPDFAYALKTKVQDIIQIFHQIDKHSVFFQSIEKRLTKSIEPLTFEESSLQWGDDVWIAEHPLKPETEQKEWGEGTKRLIHTLLVGMQVSEQAINVAKTIENNAHLRLRAQQMQEKMRAAVKPEILASIERDAAFLGTLLSDKYENLKNTQQREQLTRRHPAIRPLLEKVMVTHREIAPSREQILDLVDAYVLKETVAISSTGNPFAHRSLEEWWEVFSTDEEAKENHTKESVQWLSGKIRAIGSGLMSTSSVENTQDLVTARRNDYTKELKQATATLSKCELALLSLNGASEKPDALQDYIKKIYHELIDVAQAIPPTSCTLSQLAAWNQKVHDLSYAVTSLDKQMALWMSPKFSSNDQTDQTVFEPVKTYVAENIRVVHRPLPPKEGVFSKVKGFFKNIVELVAGPSGKKVDWNKLPEKADRSSLIFNEIWSPSTTKFFNAFVEDDESWSSTPIEHYEQIHNHFTTALEDGKKAVQNIFNDLQERKNTLSDKLPSEERIDFLKSIQELEYTAHKLQQKKEPETTPICEVIDWIREVEAFRKSVISLCDQIVESSTRAIRNEQSLIELKAFVESPSVSIDKKLFYHLIGDLYGAYSRLEGGWATVMWQYRLQLLKKRLAVSEMPEEIAFYQELITKIEQGVEFSKNYLFPFEIFAQEMQTTLEGLAPGETILLEGGWTTYSGGHAMVYEIRKQENGNYAFTIYNTGGGLGYFSNMRIGLQNKAIFFVEQEEISAERLFSRPILKILWDLKNSPPQENEAWEASDIMESLFPLLGGSYIQRIVPFEKVKTPQRSGTCSMMSLIAWLYDQSAKSDIARIQFEHRFKSLVDYYKKYKHAAFIDEQARELLEKSLREFSQETLKAYAKQGIISPQELEYTLHVINPIRQEFTAFLDRLDFWREGIAPSGDLVHIFTFFFLKDLPKTTAVEEDSYISPYEQGEISFEYNLATLNQDLLRVAAEARVGIKEGKKHVIADSITNIIAAIPLNLSENVSPEMAKELVASISAMGKMYAASLLTQGDPSEKSPPKITPKQHVSFIKLLTLAYRLSQREGNPFAFRLPPLLANTMNHELTGFSIFDPAYDHELMQIVDFWNSKEANISDINKPFKENYSGLKVSRLTQGRYREEKIYGEEETDLIFADPLQRFQDDPEIQIMVQNKIPNFQEATKLDLKIFLFVDNLYFKLADNLYFKLNHVIRKRDVFPPTYYELRDLFSLNYIININPRVMWQENIDLDHPVVFNAYESGSRTDIGNPLEWAISYEIFNYSPYHDIYQAIIDYQGVFRLKPPHYDERNVVISDDDTPRRFKPNLAVVQLPEIEKMNYQEVRDLTALRSSSTQEIERAIAYFAQPHILSKFREKHTLLDLLLFVPGALLRHLDGHPEEVERRINQLKEFCENGIAYFEDYQKHEDLLLFLRLNRRLTRYINYTYQMHPEFNQFKGKITFPDTQQKAHDLMNDQSLSMQMRIKAAGELALTYEDIPILTHSEAVELLKATTFFHGMALSKKDQDLLISEDIRKLLDDRKEEIKAAVEKNPSQFFNEAFSQTQNWHLETYPVYMSEDRLWMVDIYAGTLKFLGRGLSLLPGNVAHLFYIYNLFPEPPMYVYQNGQFYYLEDKGYKYRATHETLERLIDGKWFKYNSLIRLSVDFPMHLGHKLVGTWIADNIAYFTDKQTGAFIAKTDAEKRIWGLDGTGKINNLVLGGPPSALFSRIEDPNWIREWKDVDADSPTKVELPQLKIMFEAKYDSQGVKRFYISDPEGYYLASYQHVKSLRDFPHYLLLENNKGSQLVLLPLRQFYHHEGSFTTESSLQDDTPVDKYSNDQLQKIHSIKLKIDTNQQLIPSNNQERFFLALIYLKIHDYAKAKDLLIGLGDTYRGHRSHINPFSKEERDILEWIIKLDEKKPDPDPRAISLRLRASYLLLKNDHYFASKEKSSSFFTNLSQCQKAFDTYLSVINNVSEFEFEIEEELFILSQIDNSTKWETRRKFLLSKNKDPSQSVESSQDDRWIANFQYRGSRKDPESDSFALMMAFRAQKGPATHSLLRPHIMRYFLRIYELMKNQLTHEEAQKIVEEFGNYKVPEGLTLEELKKEMLLCLLIAAQSTKSNIDLDVIYTLIAVYKDPNHPKFISKGQLELKLNDRKEYRSIDDLNDILILGKNDSSFRESMLAKPSNIKKMDQIETRLHKRKKTQLAKKLSPAFEQSIALYPPRQLTSLNAPNITEKIIETKVTQSEKHGLGQVQEELTAVFSLDTGQSVPNRLFKRTQESIVNYIEQLGPESQIRYDFKTAENLQAYKQELNSIIKEYGHTLNNEVTRLLSSANKDPVDPTAVAEKHLKVTSGEEKLISHIDLLLLFLKRDMDGFHRRNPALTQEEIALLNQETLNYLISATHLQSLQRQMRLIEEIETAPSNEDREEIVQKLVAAAQSKREYNPHEHPAYLIFEFFMDILLYKSQVESIHKLRIRRGKIENHKEIGNVLEIMTGAGKTDTLLILLAYLNADGDNLSIVVLTEEMLSNAADKIASRLGIGLDIEVQKISFSRDSSVLAKHLQILLNRLNQIRTERQVLLISNDAIMSLYLKMIETFMMAEASTNRSEYYESLQIFGEIFGLFHHHGVAILDEIDAILAALKQYLFTIQNTPDGTPQPITPIYTQFVLELYRSFLTDSRWRMDLEFEPNPTAPTFTKEHFNSIKEAFVKDLVHRHLGINDKKVRDFFFKLSPAEISFVEDYVMGQADNAAKQFVTSQEKTIRGLLDLAYGQIDSLLILTIGKKANKQYGQDDTGVKAGALPYDGYGNPLHKNRFGLCYEDLNYSIQIYLKEGIPLKMVKQGVKKWQEEAFNELNANKRLLPSQTEKQRFLDNSFGTGSFNILTIHSKIQDLKKEIDLKTALKLYFIEKYVLKEIEYYPLYIAMGPQIYGWLFKIASGFTATTFNAETFPHNLFLPPENIAAGRTLTILWKNREHSILSVPRMKQLDSDPAKRATKMQKHLARHIPNFTDYTAMIDMGGFFRDILDNEKIVEAWLNLPQVKEKHPKIIGGHYFDVDNKPRVIERSKEIDPENIAVTQLKKESQPAAESNLLKSQKLFYFGLKQITGIDEKLPLTTKALVFVGSDTVLRELLQAVGRLRGLGGQLPFFVVPDEVKDMIQATLKPLLKSPIEENLKLEHILLFVAYNQAMLQGEDNVRSFKQKLLAVLHEAFNEAVIDKSISIEEKIQLFSEIKNLFVFKISDDPTHLFGNRNEDQDRKTVVAAELKKQKESKEAKELKKFPAFKDHPYIQNLDQQLENVAKKEEPLQPEKIITNTNYGISLQVQAEAQTKTNTDTQTQANTEIDTDAEYRLYNNKHSPMTVKSWVKEKIFSQSLYLNVTAPITNLNEAIEKNSNIKSLFDFNVQTTLNLMPHLYDDDALQPPPFKPFNFYQKNVDSILVIQNKQTGEFSSVFLDQNDTEFLREFLIEDQSVKDISNREVKLCLISMQDTSLFVQGKERIDMEFIESDSKVKRWLVQAKFFNGVVDYSTQELIILEEWIKEKGISEMKEFFTMTVLKFKPLSRQHFPLSSLEKLFNSLAEKPRMTVIR